MAKFYRENRVLIGEELQSRILLLDWITQAFEMGEHPIEMFRILKEDGGYFTKRLDTLPVGIPKPYRIEPRHCHHNNILQAVVLTEQQPEILDEFKFISGFYGMKAIDPSVPQGKEYFIAHHTFMTYQGAVLDYTVLLHPPIAYEVDQYFGLAFEIQTVVDAYNKFIDNGDNISTASVFEVLRDEPYVLP